MVQRQVTAALSCFCLGLLQEKSTQTVRLGVINTSPVEEYVLCLSYRETTPVMFFSYNTMERPLYVLLTE